MFLKFKVFFDLDKIAIIFIISKPNDSKSSHTSITLLPVVTTSSITITFLSLVKLPSIILPNPYFLFFSYKALVSTLYLILYFCSVLIWCTTNKIGFFVYFFNDFITNIIMKFRKTYN